MYFLDEANNVIVLNFPSMIEILDFMLGGICTQLFRSLNLINSEVLIF